MNGLRAGAGAEARATVGAGALTAVFAVVSRVVIGGVVAALAVGRGVSGGGALLSCFLGASAAAVVAPGALSVHAILAVPTTTQTWVTLAANVVVTGLTVAAGGVIALRWGRRRASRTVSSTG